MNFRYTQRADLPYGPLGHKTDMPTALQNVRSPGQKALTGRQFRFLIQRGHRLPNQNELRNLKDIVSAEVP